MSSQLPGTQSGALNGTQTSSSARQETQGPDSQITTSLHSRDFTMSNIFAFGAERNGNMADHDVPSWLTDRIINVKVGPEEQCYVVHEKLLTGQSEFFRERIEKGDGEIKLPEEEPRLFGLIVRWLYGTAFLPSGSARTFRFTPPSDDNQYTVRDYLGVYVMGGKFDITGVRNAVIDVLYGYFGEASDTHRAPNMHDVRYVFAHTTPRSPMRRFLIAHALFYLFSRGRRNEPLPQDWDEVLRGNGEVGYELIRMLAEWNWSMGHNAPRMTIKPRVDFHEKIPRQEQNVVKKEDGVEDEMAFRTQTKLLSKMEPGAHFLRLSKLPYTAAFPAAFTASLPGRDHLVSLTFCQPHTIDEPSPSHQITTHNNITAPMSHQPSPFASQLSLRPATPDGSPYYNFSVDSAAQPVVPPGIEDFLQRIRSDPELQAWYPEADMLHGCLEANAGPFFVSSFMRLADRVADDWRVRSRDPSLITAAEELRREFAMQNPYLYAAWRLYPPSQPLHSPPTAATPASPMA
ncbi:hypothetical protein VTJ49DRAFT_343 [Mycothermus thermophilus]|uniref:BTB domain-containing protein n=1 Tax=Humicola insolens TaxID=85995 RepID=A0ABR3VFD7_HUMIN